MSEKVVNFSDLGRKEIRKELSDGVIIYNPSKDKKAKILDIIFKNTKGDKINISKQDLFLELIPILTNVHFNLDREKDKDKIEEILNDPDELLEDIIDEIKEIVTKISTRTAKWITELSEMPKEQLEQLMKENNITQETEEEKEIRELEEKLNKLKNNIKDDKNE